MARVQFIHAEQMFLYYFLTSEKKKLIKENTVTPYRTGPLALVYMENFHLT